MGRGNHDESTLMNRMKLYRRRRSQKTRLIAARAPGERRTDVVQN
jgi:hypothetical protein